MQGKAVDIKGRSYNYVIMAVIMLVGAFCMTLNGTLLTTAYPLLMRDFKIGIDTVEWLTTVFLLVNGITIPLSAFFMNRFNSKYLFIVTQIIFLAGTVICAIASNFIFLIIGRIFQGIGVGISAPLLQSTFFHIFPENNRGKAMGLVGLVIGLAPAVGPTLSGYIVSRFEDWRMLFYIVLPVLLADTILCFFLLHQVIPSEKQKLDILSVIFSIIGFSSLIYGFNLAGSKGWLSFDVIAFIIFGIVIIFVFALRQMKIKDPLLEVRIFKNRKFTTGVIISATAYMALIGFESILPLFIQDVHGNTALQSGLMLLPGAILLGIMSPISGSLFDKYGAKWLSRIGVLLLAIGTFPFLFIQSNTPIGYIILFYGVRLFGTSMVLMPITTFSLNQLPKEKINDGTALNNTVRQIASSMGISLLVSIVAIVTKNNMPSASLEKTQDALYTSQALQASVKGYHMAFLVAFIFCVIAFLCTFLLDQKKKK